jgi:hypothetical protein
MAWADRILPTCLRIWGEKVIYQTVGGFETSLRAIVDMSYQVLDPDTGTLVQSRHPKMGIRVADLPNEPQTGDRVILQDITYFVAEYQPDGQGGAELFLQAIDE